MSPDAGVDEAAFSELAERYRPEMRVHCCQEERALLERYLNATDEADAEAFAEMMRDDVRFSMPPEPGLFVGRDAVIESWSPAFDREGFGRVRGVYTRANMQPAVACYLQPPEESGYRPMALDVLRIEDGAIAEVVTFQPHLFRAFGLPASL